MSLTIVMYHYVRDLARSRYPRIKGLTTDQFRGQLDFMAAHHAFVPLAEVLAAARQPEADILPANAALLTFDDGYIDHYTTVFPLLHERGIQGCFFPPARPVLEGSVLDVNKIHFILASAPDADVLVKAINAQVMEHRQEYVLNSPEQYWQTLAQPSRFDPAEVIFIKRMLQVALPQTLRNRIADELFHKFVSADESAFASELYLSVDQLRLMVRSGMYVGAHGYDHQWMDRLAPDQQAREVARSLEFLQSVGAPTRDWVMCYPYGAHNQGLENVLRDHRCALGLTTQVGVADLQRDHPLRLPRLDTNDLPKSL